MLFSSGTNLLPLSEIPKYKFDLVNNSAAGDLSATKKLSTGKVVFKGLPNPDPGNTGIIVLNGQKQSSSHHFMSMYKVITKIKNDNSMNLSTIQTPGVYINEVNGFPKFSCSGSNSGSGIYRIYTTGILRRKIVHQPSCTDYFLCGFPGFLLPSHPATPAPSPSSTARNIISFRENPTHKGSNLYSLVGVRFSFVRCLWCYIR